MDGHTDTPWTFRDVSGAGLEICAPVYQMSGVDLPKGMPEAPIHVFQFTAPQIVQIAGERWVQFEPKGWHEMQVANAAFIVQCVNSHEALVKALTGMVDMYVQLVESGDAGFWSAEDIDEVIAARAALAAATPPVMAADQGGGA